MRPCTPLIHKSLDVRNHWTGRQKSQAVRAITREASNECYAHRHRTANFPPVCRFDFRSRLGAFGLIIRYIRRFRRPVCRPRLPSMMMMMMIPSSSPLASRSRSLPNHTSSIMCARWMRPHLSLAQQPDSALYYTRHVSISNDRDPRCNVRSWPFHNTPNELP